MSKSTAQNNTGTTSTVKVVDGKLIMSLPDAQTPVVWQMDIEQAQSAAFTVEEDKKKKTFTLVLKTQDGEVQNIAPFENKETAVNILMETSGALQNAHGQIKPTTMAHASNTNIASPVAQQNDDKNNKIGAILAVLLILVLIGIWSLSASNSVQLQNDRLLAPTETAISPQDAKSASGVPVSADDFLSNR